MSGLIAAIVLIAQHLEVWPTAPSVFGGGMFILLFILAIINDVLSALDKLSKYK